MGDNSNPISFLTLPQRLGGRSAAARASMWQTLCGIRVALPCVVQSFDPVKQTITAQPVIAENVNIKSIPTPKTLPLLLDVPVIMPRAGGFVFTFPIKPGDECLVIFADMCIDAWWQSGAAKDSSGNVVGQPQADKRRHDLSDGFAIIGPWSQPRVLPNYSVTEVQLMSEDSAVIFAVSSTYAYLSVVNGGQVKIAQDSSGMTVQAFGSTQINVIAPNGINITGDVNIAGNLSATGNLDGKNFLTHTHTGVTTGGGHTGPVT